MRSWSNIFFLFSFLLMTGSVAFAQQNPGLKLMESIAADSDFFTADPLGNLYWTNREGLTKYEPAGKTYRHYSNPRYGQIHFVDVSDPLNVLVYHRDFQHIVWLDRNLAEKEAPHSAGAILPGFTGAICSSARGGFWVFVPHEMRLQQYSQNFRLETQSLPFFETLPAFSEPAFITEADGRLYVSEPEAGIAVFDAFGNLIFIIEKKEIERFQVQGNHVIWFTEKELIIFDFVLQEETVFLLPEKKIRSGLVRGSRVWVQTGNEILIYQAADRLF